MFLSSLQLHSVYEAIRSFGSFALLMSVHIMPVCLQMYAA